VRDIIKLTIALVVISLAAGLAIGLTFTKTRTKIEEQERLTQQSALQSVFPEGITIEMKEGDGELPDNYWAATRDGNLVGYAFQVSSRGYSSNIEFIVGVDTTGTILGVAILSQNETPGLGSRVKEVVSNKYIWNGLFSDEEKKESWFTEQFEGIDVDTSIIVDKSHGEWHALNPETRAELEKKNAITAITGSTISTRAVVSGIEKKVSLYFKAVQGVR
jgi:Na+-translocating ferredoxin:NAD+ oxidoreductase subunit G